MSLIHPTAVVEDGARLGADVTVGAYSVVGRDVTLGDGVSLDTHVMIRGRTTLGPRTRVATFAVVGGEAQDLSYKGEDTSVEIGPDCIIREHVTIHRGTARGRGTTTIGAECFFMIGSHIAHDCVVGDHVIMTNHATLGGHSQVGNYAILGGLSGVQQRTRVGAHSFIAGLTGINRDIIPFAMAQGRIARLAGINKVGLLRRGYTKDDVHAIHRAYVMFFQSEGTRAERLERVTAEFGASRAAGELIAFIREAGNRPLALPRKGGGNVSEDDYADNEDA